MMIGKSAVKYISSLDHASETDHGSFLFSI